MPKQPSRGDRWREACAKMREAADKVTAAVEEYNSAKEDLKSVQEEYTDWKDNLPENLQSSALGEKLETVCSIDLEADMDEPDLSALDEAEGADLPLGFGRD